MAYIGKGLDNGVRNRFVYAATQGQTAFTGADADSKTLAISDALYTDVYQNGVKLKLTTDWSATTTTVTLVNAASVDDVIEIVSFDIFAVPDTVPASTGGTFNGGIAATTGTFSGPSVTIGGGAALDSKIVFDGNAQDFHIGLDDSSDSLTIGLGSALGTTSHVVIDASGAVTVVGEGGTNTTNLQQGLTKSWSNVVGNGTAISDSFNLTSLTDNAAGSFTKTIANDMASVNYSVSGMIAPLSSQSAENIARCMNIDHGTAMTASAYRVQCVSSTNGGTNVGLEDNEDTMTQVVGDLA